MLHRLRRPIESYNRIWLAVTAVVTTTIIISAILLFGQLSPGQTQYRGEFAQAASLRAGDQVTVAGIQVGKVDGLQLAGDRVIVRFKVNRGVHLGSASRAAIKLTTLLGSRYLELSPSDTGELPDRTISLANTQVPYDLQQTLAGATTTFEQVDANRAAESLGTLSRALKDVPAALPQALDNLKSLSAIVADRRDQIGTLLANTDRVTTMIRNQKAALGSLVLQGRDLLAELARRRAALERLFAGATALVGKTKAVLDDEPKITTMLADISALLQRIHKNDALLRNIVQVMPVALRNVANASGTAQGMDLSLPGGPLIDSWMCALSSRSKEWGYLPYYRDCKPVPDPYPGWPAPDPFGRAFPGFPPDTMLTDGPVAPATAGGATPQAPAPPPSPSSSNLAPTQPSSEVPHP
jgi:phospholipid/cholesterol/gamma-HCH transport system substrate-binding protein